MKVVTIVGARPQFIKCGPVSRALRRRHREVLVHTGQHYDDAMSGVFFRQLGLPRPDHELAVGSGPHGAQTGAMLRGVEEVLLKEEPDWVLVYGDTNSTLAGALAAAKLRLPVAHVEAGLRSFNRAMPEEINRVLTDHLSSLLLCPVPLAAEHLAREGVTRGVHVVGDVMYDALLHAEDVARREGHGPAAHGLAPEGYLLATLHRPENTDDPARLRALVEALAALPGPVLLPLHPRTRKQLESAGLLAWAEERLRLLPPLPYFDFIGLLRGARAFLTDSGGAQKEAFLLGVPCVTLRSETEWVETVELGRNRLCGDLARLPALLDAPFPPFDPARNPYGDGDAAGRIVAALERAAPEDL